MLQSTYRVIQEESAILWEMIVCVILSKKVHMNMGPILNGYRDMVQHAVHCNAFTSALRLVAASLKICYEMCQTSTSQGFVHCRSSVTQW